LCCCDSSVFAAVPHIVAAIAAYIVLISNIIVAIADASSGIVALKIETIDAAISSDVAPVAYACF